MTNQMIKFFRNTDQNLLNNGEINKPERQAGKFSKYLLYTLREIVNDANEFIILSNFNSKNEIFPSYEGKNVSL